MEGIFWFPILTVFSQMASLQPWPIFALPLRHDWIVSCRAVEGAAEVCIYIRGNIVPRLREGSSRDTWWSSVRLSCYRKSGEHRVERKNGLFSNFYCIYLSATLVYTAVNQLLYTWKFTTWRIQYWVSYSTHITVLFTHRNARNEHLTTITPTEFFPEPCTAHIHAHSKNSSPRKPCLSYIKSTSRNLVECILKPSNMIFTPKDKIMSYITIPNPTFSQKMHKYNELVNIILYPFVVELGKLFGNIPSFLCRCWRMKISKGRTANFTMPLALQRKWEVKTLV